MSDINIIIPVFNRPELLVDCLWSLLRDSGNFKLIIVDDGSDLKSKAIIKNIVRHINDIILITNPENQGFIKSVNRALREFPAETAVILNSDTLVVPNWLNNLLKGFDSPHNFQILGPLTYSNSPYQNLSISFAELASAEKILQDYRIQNNRSEFIEVPYLYATCLAIKQEVITRCGYFNEDYAKGYFEDVDFCFRARQAGFKIGLCNSSYVYHLQSQSFKASEQQALLRKNYQIFKYRWQEHPDYKFLPDYEKIIFHA